MAEHKSQIPNSRSQLNFAIQVLTLIEVFVLGIEFL